MLDEPAWRLSEQIAAGTLTSEALMAATLDRIAAVNPTLNAIVSLQDADVLMAAARRADQTPRQGWLHGLPIAIKDLAQVAGFPTSRGSPVFAGDMARVTDPHVARMQAAGGIVIGKTNTPEFGLGSHTYNPVFGATQNALRTGTSAGGSSGGAAVALAAGMVPVADGSDMMGSLRNPAGWNGIYGLRPSYGIVPDAGDGDLFLHPLATNGPMGRCPRDVAQLLETQTGRADAAAHLSEPLAGARIGWLGDWAGAYPMEKGVLSHCRAALTRLEQAGCDVRDADPGFSAAALWDAWVTLRAFAIAARLGPLYDAHPDALKPEAIWEVTTGRSFSAAEIQRASNLRSDWYRAAMRLFADYDALVLPTAQCWPFPVDWDWPKAIGDTTMDTYHRWMEVVIPASLIGLPALAVPTDEPMGLQLIGPPGHDAQMLRLGQMWANAAP